MEPAIELTHEDIEMLITQYIFNANNPRRASMAKESAWDRARYWMDVRDRLRLRDFGDKRIPA